MLPLKKPADPTDKAAVKKHEFLIADRATKDKVHVYDFGALDESYTQFAYEKVKDETYDASQWECYHYGSGESDNWCKGNPTKNGKEFKFTRGDDSQAPGCGGCWCCVRTAGALLVDFHHESGQLHY